jgi:hypothetical protein
MGPNWWRTDATLAARLRDLVAGPRMEVVRLTSLGVIHVTG